jgi:hypothetical protein
MTAVHRSIEAAERVLTHPPVPTGEVDARWQALTEVAEFVPSNPDDVWLFVARWGACPDEEVRAAIATCLLEHLLEHHFDRVFPLVEGAVTNPLFADTFSLCWKFGQAQLPANAARFDRLRGEVAARRGIQASRTDPLQSA